MALLGKQFGGMKSHQASSGETGELWIVSYADMMTLLFGFFVILFSLSQVDEKKFSNLGRQLAEQFKGQVDKSEMESEYQMEARQVRALQMMVAMLNLGDNVERVVQTIEKKSAEGKTKEMAKALLTEEFKKTDSKALEDLRLALAERDDHLEIALPDLMLFESGTADLTPKAKIGLARLADYLNKMKGMAGIEVVGHTDSVPPLSNAKYPSNFALSAARAGAVAEELIKHGMDPRNVLTRGMANLQPLFPERNSDGRLNRENMTRNRRVSIVVKKAQNG